MTAEALQALRDKYNKEAPRVTEEQKQAHEQKLKELGNVIFPILIEFEFEEFTDVALVLPVIIEPIKLAIPARV